MSYRKTYREKFISGKTSADKFALPKYAINASKDVYNDNGNKKSHNRSIGSNVPVPVNKKKRLSCDTTASVEHAIDPDSSKAEKNQCGWCQNSGHNQKKCPERAAFGSVIESTIDLSKVVGKS